MSFGQLIKVRILLAREKYLLVRHWQKYLTALKIVPDFSYTKPQPNTRLLFVHRKVGNTEFYWVNNRNNAAEDLEATFRVAGKAAEVWHPETGHIEQSSYTIANGLTTIPLHLEPNDAVFVVFRNKAKGSSLTIPLKEEKQLAVIEGPWNLSFQPDRGAPVQVSFETLTAWNENTDPGVKYFSGTGSYTKTINAPAEWLKEGTQLWLDLGSSEKPCRSDH